MICPKCGDESNDGIKFCNKCGENLAVISEASRKKATISLILGITGLFLGGILGVIGLVFAIKSIMIKKNSIAIAGIILNSFQLLIFLLVIIATIGTISVRGMRQDSMIQTITDSTLPYVESMPILTWFSGIGTITTQTRDTPARTVIVVMHLGHNVGDTVSSDELFGRQHELRDFTMRYFSMRTAEELLPENEERLRREIMEILNTRYLNNAWIRNVIFERLDVFESF